MAQADQRHEPTPESVMNNQEFLTGGFGELDQSQEKSKEAAKRAFDQKLEKAKKYAKKLDGAEGTLAHEVLEDLLNKTWRLPSWDPSQSEKQAYFNEGQKSIVAYILRQINRARTGEIGGQTRDQYIDQYGGR